MKTSRALFSIGLVVVMGAAYGQHVGALQSSIRSLLLSAAPPTHDTITVWGDPKNPDRNPPNNLNNIAAISVGSNFGLALQSDGHVRAWGNNSSHQTDVPGDAHDVTAISAGWNHSLALRKDGTVVAWGDNGFGQTNVPHGLKNIVAVSAGLDFSLALTKAGTVVAWGADTDGQINVPAGLNNVESVSAGGLIAGAVTKDGHLVVWGDSGNNVFGLPADAFPYGLQLVTQLPNVTSLSLGYDHGLVIANNLVWQFGNYGNSNTPFTTNQHDFSGPIQLIDPIFDGTQVKQMSAGYDSSLILANNGLIASYGYDGNHEVDVPASLTNLSQIAAGNTFSIALVKGAHGVAPFAVTK